MVITLPSVSDFKPVKGENIMTEYTTEQLVTRWEDQRTLKNMMGKYVNCLILNREQDIFELFWSTRKDTCLNFNDGAYIGPDAIKSYYQACCDRNMLVARLLSARFPDKLGNLTDEQLYGIGPFKVKPLASPVIEIAGDGETAKGLWYCQGAYNDVEACGPVARWTWGYFAADFIREEGIWKIWHLSYTNDVDCVCGESWGKPAEIHPTLPEFAALEDFSYPEYTIRKNIRDYYSPSRPHTDAPRIPEPYHTFAETFSYEITEERA